MPTNSGPTIDETVSFEMKLQSWIHSKYVQEEFVEYCKLETRPLGSEGWNIVCIPNAFNYFIVGYTKTNSGYIRSMELLRSAPGSCSADLIRQSRGRR
jgi:hypothetical protein